MKFWYLVLLTLFAVVCRGEENAGGSDEEMLEAHRKLLNIEKPSNRSRYVVGGFDAKRVHWPFITGLFKLAGGRWHHVCGGSVLNNQFVLTAAHCFRKMVKTPRGLVPNIDADRRGYTVHAGDYNIASLRDGAIEVKIANIIVHPKYTGKENTDPFDIALIKLARPLTFNNFIKPIPLPPLNFAFDNGQFNCHAAGWGLQQVEPRIKPNILQQLDAPILAGPVCINYWGHHVKPAVNMCLGNGGKATCRGDSGGPAVCPLNNKYVLAGIMSFGGDDCMYRPGVLLKVSPYVGWITQTMKQWMNARG